MSAAAPARDAGGRIPELDGLRGIAIGMVLIYHYFQSTWITKPGSFAAYVQAAGRLTWTGVDLFFVLSGFLIGGILLDARESPNYFRVFYTRRFFRIVPIYAALLLVLPTLVAVGSWVKPGSLHWFHGRTTPWYSYWIFAQNFWMARAGDLGGYGLWMTWSLAVEEQFYLTMPVLVRFLSLRSFVISVLLGICAAPALRMTLHFFWPENWIPGYVLMPCRMDALLLGVLAAILIRGAGRRERIQKWKSVFPVLLLILSVGVAFLALRSASAVSPLMAKVGFTWMALTYATFLVYALTCPSSRLSRALRFKWLGWLGAVAYGVYLLHQPIQGLLFGYFGGGTPVIDGGYTLLLTLAALILTVAIARVSWLYFERPLIRLGHRSKYESAVPGAKEPRQPAPELACT
jgi:peptidoglycan/LPS O-acetylase OafA/YrhL